MTGKGMSAMLSDGPEAYRDNLDFVNVLNLNQTPLEFLPQGATSPLRAATRACKAGPSTPARGSPSTPRAGPPSRQTGPAAAGAG